MLPNGRTWTRLYVIASLFLAVGCGLDDYEKRIDTQSVALKKFDEESKALGEPLELPGGRGPGVPLIG